MERLDFSFYKALYDELEMYEDVLLQLQRDYEREKREEFIIAIDFSELHDYIHAESKDSKRAAINKYILNKSHDQFTILPGSYYELLNDIENISQSISKPGLTILIKKHKSVFDFFSEFPKAIQNYDDAIDLYRNRYGNAEKEVETAISFLLKELVPNYKSIEALRDLVRDRKIVPISGIEQIGNITLSTKEEYRNVYKFIESKLSLYRSNKPINNQIDAIDSTITMLLNQKKEEINRYITIYTQAIHLLDVLRSHKELRWENDYLVRDAQYLKLRTNLQNIYKTKEKRLEYVNTWLNRCKKLKSDIIDIVDIHNKLLEKNSFEPSLKLIGLYKDFDEECKKPLSYMESSIEQETTKEEIMNIYQILKEKGIYEGKVEQSFDILKEHFRSIISKELSSFNSFLEDSADISKFLDNIRKWLGIN